MADFPLGEKDERKALSAGQGSSTTSISAQ